VNAKENIHQIEVETSGDTYIAKQGQHILITALLCMRFGLTPSIDTITYHH
jgi:hypothetical protein